MRNGIASFINGSYANNVREHVREQGFNWKIIGTYGTATTINACFNGKIIGRYGKASTINACFNGIIIGTFGKAATINGCFNGIIIGTHGKATYIYIYTYQCIFLRGTQ